MQAIQSKFIGPTNTRPARIKATCAAGSITISHPQDLSGQAAHRQAAQALLDKLHWGYKILGGNLPDGNYCFVLDSPHNLE
jgi:hypothetical protein